jgi:hypothetical protein
MLPLALPCLCGPLAGWRLHALLHPNGTSRQEKISFRTFMKSGPATGMAGPASV